jgi:transcriptional regulator with XRE-family HTH domain
MDAGSGPPLWARRIRQYRTLGAWSQQDLAGELNRLDPQARLDGNTVSRWERGLYRPSPFYARLLASCFHVTPAEMALVDAGSQEDSVHRRDFLRDSMGMAAAIGSAAAVPIERIQHVFGKRAGVDAQAVSAMADVLLSLERLQRHIAPAALLGPTVGHLQAMTATLRSSMPSGLRRGLSSIAAETACMVGALRHASGDAEGAVHYFELAMRAARDAGDDALGAYIAGQRAMCEREDGRIPLAESARIFSEGGYGFTAGAATTPARVWLLAKAADAHAQMGDEEAAMRALASAQDLLNRRPVEEEESRPRTPPSSWDQRWLDGEVGTTLSRLGATDRARDALDAALVAITPELRIDQLWLLLAKSRTYVDDREPEEASRLALQVLAEARQLNYPPLMVEVQTLGERLRHWRRRPRVGELREALAEIA